MVPDGLGGLIAVLVFIAPGVAYESVLLRTRPAIRATSFREVNRIVLVSLAAWALPAAGWVLPSISLEGRWWGDRVLGLLDGSLTASADPTAATLLGLTAGLAIGIATLSASLGTRGISSTIQPKTAWYVALHQMRREDRPYLWVTTNDGTVWGGYYKVGDVRDVPMDERDLLLGDDIRVRHPGYKAAQPVEGAHVLALNGGVIKAISVAYIRVPSGDL